MTAACSISCRLAMVIPHCFFLSGSVLNRYPGFSRSVANYSYMCPKTLTYLSCFHSMFQINPYTLYFFLCKHKQCHLLCFSIWNLCTILKCCTIKSPSRGESFSCCFAEVVPVWDQTFFFFFFLPIYFYNNSI